MLPKQWQNKFHSFPELNGQTPIGFCVYCHKSLTWSEFPDSCLGYDLFWVSLYLSNSFFFFIEYKLLKQRKSAIYSDKTMERQMQDRQS